MDCNHWMLELAELVNMEGDHDDHEEVDLLYEANILDLFYHYLYARKVELSLIIRFYFKHMHESPAMRNKKNNFFCCHFPENSYNSTSSTDMTLASITWRSVESLWFVNASYLDQDRVQTL